MPASPTSPRECRAEHLAPIKIHKPVSNWLSEVSQVPAGVGGETQEQAEGLSPLSRCPRVVGPWQLKKEGSANFVPVSPGLYRHSRLVRILSQGFLHGGCHHQLSALQQFLPRARLGPKSEALHSWLKYFRQLFSREGAALNSQVPQPLHLVVDL